MGNTAKNEITGKTIQSGPQNKAYADGWDRVFAKKSATEWLKLDDIQMIDADGWRYDDGVTLDTPIKYSEYQKRLNESTVLWKSVKSS